MGVSQARSGLLVRVMLSLSMLTGMVGATPTPAAACEPPPTPFNISVVGHSGGTFSSAETTGSFLLAVRGNALVSYDMSSGAAVPAGVASVPEPEGSLFVAADRAYVVGSNRFGIYDISDPAAPELLAVANMPSSEYRIVGFFATGDYAYAGYQKLGSFGTKIFNVQDPASASVVAYSGLTLTDRRPDVVGQNAFAVTGAGRIDIIDLSSPTNPHVDGSFGTGVTDAVVDGQYLYASLGSAGGGVSAYDVSSPGSAVLQGTTPGTIGGSVDAVADRLWRVAGDSIELWNTTNKSAPALVDTDVLVGARQVVAAASPLSAYALTRPDLGGDTTLACYETASVPGMDTLFDTIAGRVGDGGSALAGDLAYLTSPAGLRILDTSIPGVPALGAAGITGEPTDVSVAGGLAALATSSGLSIVDIADPGAPSETDEFAIVGGLSRVVLLGDIAYAISPTNLLVFSVLDPNAITKLDEIAMPGLNDLDARDGRVWVTKATGSTSGTVLEYDASDPFDLVKTAEHSLPGGMPAVTVTTETAFVGLTDPSWGGSAIKAFDISEPGTLYYTNWIDAGRWMASDVVADDGILIAAGAGGVQQLGVFEPSMPYQMGFAPTPGDRTAVDAELIALSSASGGTTFMRYDPVSFRTFGGTRFDTAIAMSQTFDSSEYVVLATGRSYPDALAGVPLAYALDAPILLTERDHIPDEVVAEILRLGATKAIVLGGTTAMSDNIVAQLRSIGMDGNTIERIFGATRYETAKAIALRLQQVYGAGTIDKAFVATGLNFPDALAAAGAAAKAGCPILLVKPGDSNTAALAAVAALGIDDTVIVGGTAVVPADIAAMFPSPERLAGNNRYATAVRIANWSLADFDTAFDPASLFVVTGTNFPDALACGVVAAGSDAPTLLVGSDPPPETLGFIRDNAGAIVRVDIVGGDAAVSSAVERWLVNYVR